MSKPPDTTVFRKLAFYVCRFFWPPYGKQAFEVIQKPLELEVSSHTQLATHAGLLSSIMILFFFWYQLRKMYKKQKVARRQENLSIVNESNESIEQTFDVANNRAWITDMSTQTIGGLEQLPTLDRSGQETSTTSCIRPQRPSQKETLKPKPASERKWKL